MRVFVYYNLHRKLWSIRALEGPQKGLVIQHAHSVSLDNASGRVSEAGRLRVLREKCKNVHAGIVGTLIATSNTFPGPHDGLWTEVTYNPYKYKTFVHKDTLEPYAGSVVALLHNRKVYI
jgi:hypothetical protein